MRHTFYIKAPHSYRDEGLKRPVAPGRQPEPPRMVKLFVCALCRHRGGTLKNIGTHKEPRYVHPSCQTANDKRIAAGGQI